MRGRGQLRWLIRTLAVTPTLAALGLVPELPAQATPFAVTDAILAGVEFQGDAVWNGGGFYGYNALFLGKLGGYLTDDLIVYGAAGGGWIASTPSYALGGGVEMAIADQFSVRGEALATGSWGGGFNGGKITAGLLWHLD